MTRSTSPSHIGLLLSLASSLGRQELTDWCPSARATPATSCPCRRNGTDRVSYVDAPRSICKRRGISRHGEAPSWRGECLCGETDLSWWRRTPSSTPRRPSSAQWRRRLPLQWKLTSPSLSSMVSGSSRSATLYTDTTIHAIVRKYLCSKAPSGSWAGGGRLSSAALGDQELEQFREENHWARV